MNRGVLFDCRFEYDSGFDLDFKFQTDEKKSQEALAIVGPSGSGKTTILSLIAGLLGNGSGKIVVSGETYLDSGDGINLKPWRRNVGFLFQHDSLFPHLSVEKNLRFGTPKPTSDTVKASIWLFDELIQQLEIDLLLDRSVNSLSGGQKQRIALGRTLLSQPRILLLDEPLNAVQPSLRNSILESVKTKVREAEIPLLLVSHNRDVVDCIADRVLAIRRGKSVATVN